MAPEVKSRFEKLEARLSKQEASLTRVEDKTDSYFGRLLKEMAALTNAVSKNKQSPVDRRNVAPASRVNKRHAASLDESAIRAEDSLSDMSQ